MVNFFKKKNFVPIFISCILFGSAVVAIGFNFIEQTTAIKDMKNDMRQGFKQLSTSQVSDRDDLRKHLLLLREELIKYKSQQEGRDQILALSKPNQEIIPTPTSQASEEIKGIIKLKKIWPKADVYKEMKASSTIIGQLIKDKLYFVYEEDSSWYKIEYDLGTYGWIQKSLVDEI